MQSHEEFDPLLVAEAAMAAWEHGKDSAQWEPLEKAIEWFRILVEHSDEGARAKWLRYLADALATLGELKGEMALLVVAAATYHAALEESTRELAPLERPKIKNNLGNALRTLGELEKESAPDSGAAHLEEAVAAFGEASDELPRERMPLEWAQTQMNLGNALATLGELKKEPVLLKKAVTTYRDVLQEWTRERVPVDWAMTQMNLGNALATLGEWEESGTTQLKEAVAAFREALEALKEAEATRERVPLLWAATQVGLGHALAILGERASDTMQLDQAVDAYREALKELTPGHVQWAKTQVVLGTALKALGECESRTERLIEAVNAYREALKDQPRARAARMGQDSGKPRGGPPCVFRHGPAAASSR
jgi:tetratricopeptide (TPR) repeat protein